MVKEIVASSNTFDIYVCCHIGVLGQLPLRLYENYSLVQLYITTRITTHYTDIPYHCKDCKLNVFISADS